MDRADPYQAESRALRALEQIDANNPELAAVMSGWTWLFDEDMHDDEASVIEYLADLGVRGLALVRPLAALPWMADDIERWEASAVSDLYAAALLDADFAVELVTAPWVADGVSLLEVLFGIDALSQIAGQRFITIINLQDDTSEVKSIPGGADLARRMMALIDSPPSGRDLFLLSKLNVIRQENPEAFERLLEEPWFVDGLDEEERILLIAVIGSGSEDHLSEAHTVASATIDLPHSGNVNLWAVWLGRSHPEQAILDELEKAVRGSEQFWGLPFPTDDVILFLEDDEECVRKGRTECRGEHLGQLMLLFTYQGNPGSGTLYHEVAHYFFSAGPSWFDEGGAELVRLYVENDGNIPPVEFPNYCAEEGVANLQALNDLGGGQVWDSCRYSMGLHFLTTLRDAMGEDAWMAALRAFYLEFGYEGLYVSTGDNPEDEDVYRVVMAHTPPQLVDRVRDVFSRLHGGAFVDAQQAS